MFWKKKATQSNSPPAIICPCCGVEFRAVSELAETWRAEQRFERVGDPAAPLTQTWPPKAPRTKSHTRTRLEQALAVGACFTACTLTCALSSGKPMPFFVGLGTTTVVSSIVYMGSVFLGQENWDTAFRFFDRNKDGRLTLDDVRGVIYELLGEDDEQDAPPAPRTTAPGVTMGYEIHRRLTEDVQKSNGAVIEAGTIVRATLLPDHPRYNTKEKLRQVARLYFEILPEDKRNFSKRQAGQPFDDGLAQVQGELEMLGYIVKCGKADTAPRQFTKAGERWLRGV